MFSYWHSVTHDCYQDVRPFLLQNMYWTQCHIILYVLLTELGNMEDFSGNKVKANVITVKDYWK